MKVRYLVAGLLVAMLAVAASTASGGTSRSHATKIVVWLQNDAQNGWPDAVATANRLFKAQHPDVDVDVQYQSWGTHLTKFDAALAGGDAPDMIQLPPRDTLYPYADARLHSAAARALHTPVFRTLAH